MSAGKYDTCGLEPRLNESRNSARYGGCLKVQRTPERAASFTIDPVMKKNLSLAPRILSALGASVAHGAMFLETKGDPSDLVGERLGSSSSRVQAQDSRPLMEVLRK